MNEAYEVLKVLFILGLAISAIVILLFACHYILSLSRGVVSFLDRRKKSIPVEKDRRRRKR